MNKFKYSYFFLAIFITCQLITVSLANCFIKIGPLLEPGGIFVFPLMFPILDVVGEVYGYAYPRNFIWMGIICSFIFAIMVTIISSMPHPSYFKEAAAYQSVFYPTIRYVLSGFTGAFLGEFLNIYLLSKWKIRFKGQYFIPRSVASTAIGQIVLSIVVDFMAFSGKMPLESLIGMIFAGWLWKMAYEVLLVIPSWLVVKKLKEVEGADYYDINTNFSPFTFALK